MLSKIEKLREERPRVRRIFDEISDFCDKMLMVNYVLFFVFSATLIGLPTAVAFLACPEDIRGLIASVVGGFLSLILIPILINHMKRKQKKADELYEINKHLYQKLSAIFVQLLVDEYIFYGKNVKGEANTYDNDDKVKDEVKKLIAPLKKFICDNYDKMCNTFSVSLIWDIMDVYNECLHSVTKYINIRVKIRKCFRNMRRESGAKGSFYINQTAITMLCPDNDENR